MVVEMHLAGLHAAHSDVIYVTRVCKIMVYDVSSFIHKVDLFV